VQIINLNLYYHNIDSMKTVKNIFFNVKEDIFCALGNLFYKMADIQLRMEFFLMWTEILAI